jgi:hypothetical protein
MSRLWHSERQFPKDPGPETGIVTPFGAIWVIRQIRRIRMKLPSRWLARAAVPSSTAISPFERGSIPLSQISRRFVCALKEFS